MIDADVGGGGNFANEPSPSTIAFWLGSPASARSILFTDPVSEVRFHYTSFVTTRLDAFDATGNLVATTSGPANFNLGSGDPTGTFNRWDPLAVTAGGNVIVRVAVSGNVNQTGIDDLVLCKKKSIDLSLTAARVAQVVFDPDINADSRFDLVLARRAVAQLMVMASGVDPNDTRAATVKVQVGTQVVTTSLTLNQIPQQGATVELFFTPSAAGDANLVAMVDPANDISESDEQNNERTVAVDVKSTRGLQLAYIAVPNCLSFGRCYGPLAELSDTVLSSNEFIGATYPLSSFSGTLLAAQYLGDPITFLGIGLRDDILSIGLWGLLAGYERSLGVVPQDYFAYHNMPTTVGVTFCNSRGGLITDGYWTAAAHELGHSYGLACAVEEYNANPPGNPASGYWVSRAAPVNNSTCFMGSGVLRTLGTRWVDTADYNHLFRTFRTNPADPEILVIAALLHSDGTVDLRSWFLLPMGTPTESLPGNYTIQLLDSGGQTVADVSLDVSFTMHVEPLGIQPSDIVPLLVSLPYPDTAAALEIVRDGQVLATITPSTKLLDDAIDAIPDFGFTRNPEQRRPPLHAVVAAIAKMLEVGATTGAETALLNGFSNMITFWLLDGYLKGICLPGPGPSTPS